MKSLRKLNLRCTKVYCGNFWGLRERKYQELLANDINIDWSLLEPQPPFRLFTSQSMSLSNEYGEEWKVTDVFPTSANGFKTHRDHFAVAFTVDEMQDRIKAILNSENTDDYLAAQYQLESTASWNLRDTREILRKNSDWRQRLTRCLYRPLDMRFCLYSSYIMDRPREREMYHALFPNLCFATGRQGQAVGGTEWNLITVGHDVADTNLFYRGGIQYFPLYLYPDENTATLFDTSAISPWSPDFSHSNRVPNLAPDFIKALEIQLGLTFTPHPTTQLPNHPTTFTPEDVFHYAYAVFHSPTYRSRYAEFLKIDFPRLPLTSDVGLFRALAQLGADLVALHLLEDNYAAASWNLGDHKGSPLRHPITTFVEGANGATVGALSKSACYQDGPDHSGRVYLDTSNRARSSTFDGVPEDVWQFHIGGYQVLYKWLYDRRGKKGEPGRTLTPEDIAHYQRIVVALKETMRLMAEIDAVIEGHGGWPIE